MQAGEKEEKKRADSDERQETNCEVGGAGGPARFVKGCARVRVGGVDVCACQRQLDDGIDTARACCQMQWHSTVILFARVYIRTGAEQQGNDLGVRVFAAVVERRGGVMGAGVD